MGSFDSFKMPSDEEITKSIDAFNELLHTDIDDIWKISNVNNFMTAINGWICEKCDYGSNMKALSSQEKTIYYALQLEAEVNNGGFSQYFYNAYGDIANELVASFQAIGAKKQQPFAKKRYVLLNKVYHRIGSSVRCFLMRYLQMKLVIFLASATMNSTRRLII